MTASQFKKQWWENSEEKKELSCMQLPLFLSLVIYKWMHSLCTWQRVQEMQVISPAESISIYSINFRGKKNIVPSATVTYKMGLNNKRTIKRKFVAVSVKISRFDKNCYVKVVAILRIVFSWSRYCVSHAIPLDHLV